MSQAYKKVILSAVLAAFMVSVALFAYALCTNLVKQQCLVSAAGTWTCPQLNVRFHSDGILTYLDTNNESFWIDENADGEVIVVTGLFLLLFPLSALYSSLPSRKLIPAALCAFFTYGVSGSLLGVLIRALTGNPTDKYFSGGAFSLLLKLAVFVVPIAIVTSFITGLLLKPILSRWRNKSPKVLGCGQDHG